MEDESSTQRTFKTSGIVGSFGFIATIGSTDFTTLSGAIDTTFGTSSSNALCTYIDGPLEAISRLSPPSDSEIPLKKRPLSSK